MRLRPMAVMAGLAFELLSGAARAELLHFDYRDPSEPLSFNLDSAPIPQSFDAESFSLTTSNAAVYIGHSVNYFDLTFLTSVTSGGFENDYFTGGPLGELVPGDQLFSGDTAHPTFSPGTFNLMDPVGDPTTLIISAVPLPASAPLLGSAVLALGLAGFGFSQKKAAAIP